MGYIEEISFYTLPKESVPFDTTATLLGLAVS